MGIIYLILYIASFAILIWHMVENYSEIKLGDLIEAVCCSLFLAGVIYILIVLVESIAEYINEKKIWNPTIWKKKKNKA